MSTLIKVRLKSSIQVYVIARDDGREDALIPEMQTDREFLVRQTSAHWYEGDPNNIGTSFHYHKKWLVFVEEE